MTTSRRPGRPVSESPVTAPLLAVLLLVTGPGARSPVSPVLSVSAVPPVSAVLPVSAAFAGGRSASPGKAPALAQHWEREPLRAVRAGPAPSAMSAGFRWPLDGVPRPVRRFDPPPRPWLPGHRGVDLGAGSGVVVRAAGSGTVSFAGPVAGRPVVAISHAGGLRTTYEPVRPVVATGDRVAAGDPLGVLLPGHTGCPAAACLHWGLRRGEEYLDPLSLLGLGRVRLLPVTTRPASVSGSAARRRGRLPA